MNTKQIKVGLDYTIERKSGYNHCTTEQVEWVVRDNISNCVVATYKTKKEAMEWAY